MGTGERILFAIFMSWDVWPPSVIRILRWQRKSHNNTRKNKARQENKVFLIVTEDTKSAYNYFQILNMDGWEMFDKYATENEKELKENLADQMLEANGNSDQEEVERLGMEYKNIYIEVRNEAKHEFWKHKKNNWRIVSFLIVFLFVINYLLSGRITLFHKSNN